MASVSFPPPDGSTGSATIAASDAQALTPTSPAEGSPKRQDADTAKVTFEMPDGTSRTASVDPAFRSLPLSEQFAMVGRMRDAALAQNSNASPSTASSTSPTWSDDVQGGLNDLGTSVADDLKTAGGVLARHGAPQWGGDLTSSGDYVQNNLTPAAPSGASPSSRLAMALKAGQWSDVPSLALHAGLRAAVGSAPVLAAGVVDPALAAGVGALQAAGTNAYARAANNGRAAPNDSDVLGSLPADAGAAAAGYLLPGGSEGGTVFGRIASRAGSDLAAGAVGSVAGQLGDTAGTDRGAQVDPSQVAADALSGAVLGGGRAARDVAGDAAQAAGARVMQATRPGITSPEQAIALHDAQQFVSGARAADPNATDTATIQSAKKNLNGQLVGLAQRALQLGQIDQPTYQDMVGAADTANVHTNTLLDDANSPFGRVMASGAPAEVIGPWSRGVRTLQQLSTPGFLTNQTGPGRVFGRAVGEYGPAVGLLASGNVPGAIGAAVLGHGTRIPGEIGARLGGAADKMFGTTYTPLELDAANAQRYMGANGIDAPVSTLQADLASAHGALDQVQQQQAADAAQQADAASQQVPTIKPQMGIIRAMQAQSAAWRLAKAKAAASGQAGTYDPATGLQPDAVPVNTPLPAPRSSPAARLAMATAATAGPALPALRPDTLADVRMALSQDDGSGAGSFGAPTVPPGDALRGAQANTTATQAGPSRGTPETVYGAPSSAMAGPIYGAPSGGQAGPLFGAPPTDSGGFSPGTRYVANRVPGATHQSVLDAARQAEMLGKVPAGTAQLLATSPAHVDPRIGAAVQGHMLDALLLQQATGGGTNGADLSGAMVDAQGAPIRSLPAFNLAATTYHTGTVANLAAAARSSGIPGLDTMVLAVGNTHGRNAAETIPAKRAKANAFVDSMNPVVAKVAAGYLLDDALIGHG